VIDVMGFTPQEGRGTGVAICRRGSDLRLLVGSLGPQQTSADSQSGTPDTISR
jgi:hypothetical protein